MTYLNQKAALARWKKGHHVFFLFLQGLIMSVHRFERALKLRNNLKAGKALSTATNLMWGSAAALRYAGDFPEKIYDNFVRVSMSPPNVNDGFSGLLSFDHAVLIRQLIQLKETFKQLPPDLKKQHQRFVWAMSTAYDSHKYVCASFKGGEVKSLRMSESSDKTSVEVLESFKQNRLKLIKTNYAGFQCPVSTINR
jgi:hypothetical protein